MLTYSFENLGKDSLYEYLYKCIRRDILEGRIRAGEKLPSKRSFAKNLGISTITVENAYAQLQAEGYLYSVPRSGYYAARIEQELLTPAGGGEGGGALFPAAGSKVRERVLGGRTGREARESASEGMAGSKGRESAVGGIPGESELAADLTGSRTDAAQFPFTIWARLMREVLSTQRDALMCRAPGAGVPALRRAIAAYLLEYQGMQVDAGQIVIGAGTEYLYGLLIQLLGRERVYALEEPGYVKAAEIYKSYGVNTAYISMDDSGVRVEQLREKGADIAHITPSHHYPTGITTSIGRRYELLAWSGEEEERYIIEDDYDCEFRLAGRPIPPLQSIDGNGRVIYMNTFTKSLTPTIRISYMVLPWSLMERFEARLGFYACTVSNFEQYTLAEFISRGYFGKHINRMRNYYRTRRDALRRALEESPLADKIQIRGADAGLHFLMEVDTKLTDAELIGRAAAQGIRLTCLSGYFHGEGGEPHKVVVNYSGLEPEQMRQVAERLNMAWNGCPAPCLQE